MATKTLKCFRCLGSFLHSAVVSDRDARVMEIPTGDRISSDVLAEGKPPNNLAPDPFRYTLSDIEVGSSNTGTSTAIALVDSDLILLDDMNIPFVPVKTYRRKR